MQFQFLTKVVWASVILSLSSLYSTSIYTLRTEHKCSCEEHFSSKTHRSQGVIALTLLHCCAFVK